MRNAGNDSLIVNWPGPRSVDKSRAKTRRRAALKNLQSTLSACRSIHTYGEKIMGVSLPTSLMTHGLALGSQVVGATLIGQHGIIWRVKIEMSRVRSMVSTSKPQEWAWGSCSQPTSPWAASRLGSLKLGGSRLLEGVCSGGYCTDVHITMQAYFWTVQKLFWQVICTTTYGGLL